MTSRRLSLSLAAAAMAALACPITAHAQRSGAAGDTVREPSRNPLHADTLRLGVLQDEAVRRDPRARQLQLLASQSALRLRDIAATQLPAIGANAQAQYQSEVVTVPLSLRNGVSLPLPPHDTYDANVVAQQSLYDPAVGARRGVERAQLAESQARVRASLFTLRQNVNDAYFTALLLQTQRAEQEAGITDLEAQHQMVAQRVREGTALQGEAEMLQAEVLRRRQAAAELAANRDAALVVLGELTGQTIASADALALPDLGGAVTRARAAFDTLRARPEYEQFARSRDVLARQQATLGAAELPRVSAFGRAGYGRPGLNPLASDFTSYWLAGVQVQWSPWNWGTTHREREALTLQQQIVASDEAAFQQSVQRAVARDVANIDRLAHALADDDTIVALRERILRETTFRFREGVVTSAEYVDRQTDVLGARLARASHRVELAQARAHFLTSLGLEVPQ